MVIAAVTVVVLGVVVVGVVLSVRPTPPWPVDSEQLSFAVTTEGVTAHLAALQQKAALAAACADVKMALTEWWLSRHP